MGGAEWTAIGQTISTLPAHRETSQIRLTRFCNWRFLARSQDEALFLNSLLAMDKKLLRELARLLYLYRESPLALVPSGLRVIAPETP